MSEYPIIGAKYKHYKGGLYEVIGLAKHSETVEDMVVYRALYAGDFPENQTWVRPLSMWFETVTHNGIATPRFMLI